MQIKNPLGAATPRGSFLFEVIQLNNLFLIPTFIILYAIPEKSQAEHENFTLDASSPKQLFGIVHINAQY